MLDTGYVAQTIPYDLLYKYLAQLLGAGRNARTNQARTASTLLAPSEIPGSGSGGTGPGQGTGEYGPLEGQTKSMMGNLSLGRSLASTINSIAGLGIPGLGLIGVGAPLTAVNLASTIASLLGVPSGFDPSLGMPTAADIQSISDLEGAFAARAAADQAMADYADRVAAFADPIALEAWGPREIANITAAGYGDPGAFGGFGSNSLAGARGTEAGTPSTGTKGGGRNEGPNSVSNPDSPFGNDRSGESASSDPGGIGHDAGDTGQAGYAAGGVKTFHKPERPLVGEAGPEKGIFIPERMKRPGLQGNERQVRAGLQSSLRELLAARRRR